MNEFAALAKCVETELLERIVPFWETHGIDREFGGFLTCLERDGRVYDTGKQMWSQWRCVYMFAALYNAGYREARFLEYARAGFEFLSRHGRKKSGGYYFLLRRDGAPQAEDWGGAAIFSESFAAIAGGELYRATGEERFRREALNCLEYYEKSIEASQHPVLPGTPPQRQFGHELIRLNVLQVLRNTIPDPAWNHRITAVRQKLADFCEPISGLICETVNADGSFARDEQEGRLVNPGHSLEGMGFALESAPPEEQSRWLGIVRKTLTFGWDDATGGIRYYRDLEDRPLRKNECMLKAWWPQCEAALTALRAYELTGDRAFFDWFRKIDRFAWQQLRDPKYPEWFAYAAIEGRQVHSYKGSYWKSFFHLPRYLLQCRQIADRLADTATRA